MTNPAASLPSETWIAAVCAACARWYVSAVITPWQARQAVSWLVGWALGYGRTCTHVCLFPIRDTPDDPGGLPRGIPDEPWRPWSAVAKDPRSVLWQLQVGVASLKWALGGSQEGEGEKLCTIIPLMPHGLRYCNLGGLTCPASRELIGARATSPELTILRTHPHTLDPSPLPNVPLDRPSPPFQPNS